MDSKMFASLVVCLTQEIGHYLTYSDCCDVFYENKFLRN